MFIPALKKMAIFFPGSYALKDESNFTNKLVQQNN